ncbi:hypothetical protein CORC01_09279 [Colletotrichum orchidophilum]|uniref:DEUBAD domain-containing protein n=1 Tax=Colletotrichum orchidophilum TaxID=1209926 RepID=A0A1G4B211_9PEZI|nr:uncharacterized protein CORC01_09279 [Colletotrichum orchidophilum]OHE95407.1 hypothetical protein CORC01_09279 [Colletotrichum orchidophilum]
MADACVPCSSCPSSSSSFSDLSPPPSYSSDYEKRSQKAKENPPLKTVNSLDDWDDLGSPPTGAQLPNMTRRSARNSNKPKPLMPSPPRVLKRKPPTRVVPKKVPKWTTQKLLTDPKSPLASADLRAMLCQPAAWDILTKGERAEIVGLLPVGTRILDAGTDDARPDFDALRNDNNFRHDCATYADNIALGKHDPEWLEQAWGARERRRAGDFDGYVAQKFEDEWSCELPEGFRPNRSGEMPDSAALATVKEAPVKQKEESTNEEEDEVIDQAQAEGSVINQAEEMKQTATVEDVTATADAKNDVGMAKVIEAEDLSGVKLGSPIPEDTVSVKLGTPTPEISPVDLASAMPESSQVPLGCVAPENPCPKTDLHGSGLQTEKRKENEQAIMEGDEQKPVLEEDLRAGDVQEDVSAPEQRP